MPLMITLERLVLKLTLKWMYQIDIQFNSNIPMDTHYMFNGYYVREDLIATGAHITAWWNRQEDEFAVLYGSEES